MKTYRRMVAAVVVIVLVTGLGMVVLWPRAGELPEPGTPAEPLVGGEILSVERFEGDAEPMMDLSGDMVRLEIEVLGGPDRGETVTIETPVEGYPSFEAGDAVKLARSETPDGQVQYFVTDFTRTGALWALVGLFVAAVLLIGRWHGLRSLVGLGLSLLVVTRFVIPSILAGHSPSAVALFGAMAVMLVTLYFSHGVNEMTTSAVIGTAAALALTILLGSLFIDLGKLTGYSSEEAQFARFAVEGLDLKGLVLAGLIIGALGVLDDVTVSQASTVFALHAANPRQDWTDLFGRAMRVGRDHIASTVNTLFLAYAGASLALLILFSTGGLGVGEVLNTEILAEEIVKTLVGSLGLISAVPFTTALAVTVAVRRPPGAPPVAGHAHAHPHEPAPLVPAADPFGDVPDDELDDDERAYRSWLRFLREGGRGAQPHPGDDEPPDRDG